jgi:hypothetical protein
VAPAAGCDLTKDPVHLGEQQSDWESVRDPVLPLPPSEELSAYPVFETSAPSQRFRSFESCGLRLELELAGVVADDADIGFGEPGGSFGFDFEGDLHFGARVALKL